MPKVKAEMDRFGVKFKKNFNSQYTLGRKLGEGQFGTVYECHRKRGQSSHGRMAGKVIWKDRLEDPVLDSIDLISEVSVMMKLNHKNIVKIYDVFEDDIRVVIVEELVDGGELFKRIVDLGAYSEARAREYIRDIVLGMAHCHCASIAHRDLKPENILMTDDSANAVFKICDFGFAKRLGPDGHLHTQLGTAGYKAPELLVDRPRYTENVDCWSLGVIFFIMLSGGLPFYDDEEDGGLTMDQKVVRGEFYFDADEWDHVSDDAKDFIRKILVVDPKARLSCEQMLKHRWLTASSVPNKPLPQLQERISKFNARRRLRGAIHGVRAGLRLHHLGSSHKPHAAAGSYGTTGTGAAMGAKGDGDEERKAQPVS